MGNKEKIDITDTKVWGPKAWYLIHAITRNLVKNSPGKSGERVEQVKRRVIDFFYILIRV